jgi:hypothetical protein
MASISKRGPHQFQVQIRRKGYPAKQLTFESRREAEAWATTIESEMHRGVWRCARRSVAKGEIEPPVQEFSKPHYSFAEST